MGRWHPVCAALMALFFGFVTQMASQLQTLSTPMPSQFLLILPYVATIIAVAGLDRDGCAHRPPTASRTRRAEMRRHRRSTGSGLRGAARAI